VDEDKQDQQMLEKGIARGQQLMQECVKFRLTISEFSTNKGFDAQTKDEIAEVTGMHKSAVSGSKRLYDSQCDPIKNARDVLRAAKSLVDGMTIPLEHFKGVGKDAGYRLLEVGKADDLQRELEGHKLNIQAAQERLNSERDVILAASRVLLGPKFDEDDYPVAFLLEMDWHIEPAILPEYMAAVMPQSFRRAMEKAENTFQRTAEQAVEDFMAEFLATVQSWTDRLGPKIKVYPTKDHELFKYRGAEILERQTPETHPGEVPSGKFRLLLGHKPKSRGNGRQKRTDVLTGMLTQADYAELHPDEDTTDKKTFKNSTIQNLMDVVKKFRNVSEMLGSPAGFETIINRVSEHLASVGDSETVAKELRNSSFFRKETVALMTDLGSTLEGEIVEVQARRRKITYKKD
jgi:hypothetical protein